MNNRKNKAENYPFTEVKDGKFLKQELSKQENENPYCNERNKNSKGNGKKKLTLSMVINGSHTSTKNRKKQTKRKITKDKSHKSVISPSSDRISESNAIVISETDSCASEKLSSHSSLSDISPTCNSKSQFLNQDERKSPVKSINSINNAQSSLVSESLPSLHSQHVPYQSKCHISVTSLNSNDLNVNEKDKLTNYESTFLPTNTLPEIKINLEAGFDVSVATGNTPNAILDNSNLKTIPNLFDSNLINDTGQIVTKDILHDISDSNNYLSLKKYFMLLINRFNTTGNSKEHLVCNHLKIKPLIKPSDFNYEKNNAFEIAVDMSTVNAANDYIKENASKFEAFSVFSPDDVHNLEKPSDLSMNFIDSNDFNLEDTESELSICSYRTADIQPEFFDMTFSENPENMPENFSVGNMNPNTEVHSFELNTSATEVCHGASQILSENNVVNDVTDIFTTKVPSKGKKRRRREVWSYPIKRCHRKKNNQNSVSILENVQNEEDLCDTWDDSELEEDTTTGSFFPKDISGVEKCKELEKVSEPCAAFSTYVLSSIDEEQFKNVKQKREKINTKVISETKNSYHKTENNKETVPNLSSGEVLSDTYDGDTEHATNSDSQKTIVSKLVENIIESSCQNDVIVGNTSDGLIDEPNLETASHLSCNSEIEMSSNLKTDSGVFNNKSKKKKLEKTLYGKSNESIKCSIDLKILNDTNPCSDNEADICNSEVKSKDKCNLSLNVKNSLDFNSATKIQDTLPSKKELAECLDKNWIIKVRRLEELLSSEDMSNFAHSCQNFSEIVKQLTNLNDTCTNNTTTLLKNSSPTNLDKSNKCNSESLFKNCLCNSGDCTSKCNCRFKKSPIKCSSQKSLTDGTLSSKVPKSSSFVSFDCSPSSLNKSDRNYDFQPTYIASDYNIKIDDKQCQNLKDVKYSPSAEKNSPNKNKGKVIKTISDGENLSSALGSMNNSTQDSNNSNSISTASISSAVSSDNLINIPTSKPSKAKSKKSTVEQDNVNKQSSKLKSTIKKNRNVKMSTAKKQITSMMYRTDHLADNDWSLSEVDSQNLNSSPCLNKDISATESSKNDHVTSLLANNPATEVQTTNSPTSQAVSEDFKKVISKVSLLPKSSFTKSKKNAQTFEKQGVIRIENSPCKDKEISTLFSQNNLDCLKSPNKTTGAEIVKHTITEENLEKPVHKKKVISNLKNKTKAKASLKQPKCRKIQKSSIDKSQITNQEEGLNSSPCKDKEITPLVSQNNLNCLKSPNKTTRAEILEHAITEENLDISVHKEVISNLKIKTKAKASLKRSKCRKFQESSNDESQNTHQEEELNAFPCKEKEISPLVSQNKLNCLKSPNKTTRAEILEHTIEENLDKPLHKKKVISNLKNKTKANTSLKQPKCKKIQKSSDVESQNANCGEKLNSPPKKDVSISKSKVGKNAFKVGKANPSPMQDVTLNKECIVLLAVNENVGDVDCKDVCLNIIQNSDDKVPKKQSALEKRVKSSVNYESEKNVKPLKQNRETESTEIPIKASESKILKDCEPEKLNKNSVKEKISKMVNDNKTKNEVNSKISLSKSNESHLTQILKDNSSENLDIQISSNIDSDLMKESICTEIVHCENLSKLSSVEQIESMNQNKELPDKSTGLTKFHVGVHAKSPERSPENNSDYADTILLFEEDLDFEPDQIDDLKNEGSVFSNSSNSAVPREDFPKDNLKLPNQNQLDTNLDKTIESEVNGSDNIICDNESFHTFPFEQLINNFNAHLPKRDLLSEDDSDTEVEHSYKRARYEGPSFRYVDLKKSKEISDKLSKQNHTLPNKESCLKNSNDDCQKDVSINRFCEPSSENSNVSRISDLKDVCTQIKKCCHTNSYGEAVDLARTFIEISSYDTNKYIIKKLLINFFLSIKPIAKANTDFKVFDNILKLMHDFNLFDKKISSYFITKCCMHPNLEIYSIRMFHICQSKNIPLKTKAIDAYSLFLKSEEMSLAVLLNFLNFVKCLCNKKVSKDLTHLAFEKSKTCKFSDIHEMCSFLHHITPMEVDELDLEGFLQLCFKKGMWPYIAEIFMMWDSKPYLTKNIFAALSKGNETVGKYFTKFADAVHDRETSLHPELNFMFGCIGTCLMLNTFLKDHLRSTHEILQALHTYNVNYFELCKNASDVCKKTFPFYLVFISIDVCLHLKRPKNAFTIFQEFSWITPTEDLNEAEKKYVFDEKYQRLFKLVPLLNKRAYLSEGWEAIKQLAIGVEQNLSQETLSEKTEELCSIYNKLLISLLNSGKISLAFDLYKHSTGPKKDCFVFTPSVLRGLVVAFHQYDFHEANFLFTIGIMKEVYPIKKPEPGNFPWNITIWSNWTVTEIKLAIEWFIYTVFPLLMSKPNDTKFEKWFSFKIIFKVVDESNKKASSKIHCLLESEADSNYITKTKDILQAMDPSLQYIEETDALCITSDSLYSYWKKRYPDASPKCLTYKSLLSKKKLPFGSEKIQSVEAETDEHLNESQSQGGPFETPAKIYEIRSSKHSCSSVSPKCSPSTPRSKIFSPANSETSSPAQKLPAVIQTSIPNRLSDVSVHESPNKRDSLGSDSPKSLSLNDNQTLQSKISFSDLISATSSRISTNTTHFGEDKLKQRNVSEPSNNYLTKTSTKIIPATFNKPTTETPCNSNSIKGVSSDKQISKRRFLNPQVKCTKKKLGTFVSASLKSNPIMKTKLVTAPKGMPRKKNKEQYSNLTISFQNNTSVRTVSSSPQGAPVAPLTIQKIVKTNQKRVSVSSNEEKVAKLSIEEPDAQNMSEPATCNVQKQKRDLNIHVTIPQKVSTLVAQTRTIQSTNLESNSETKQLSKVSHIPPQTIQPKCSKPLLKRNCDIRVSKNFIFDSTKVKTVVIPAAPNSDASIIPVTFIKKEQKDVSRKRKMVSLKSEKAGTSFSKRSRSCSNEDFKKISAFLLSQLKMKLKCGNLSEEELKSRADELADVFIIDKKLATLDKKAIKELNDFSKLSI